MFVFLTSISPMSPHQNGIHKGKILSSSPCHIHAAQPGTSYALIQYLLSNWVNSQNPQGLSLHQLLCRSHKSFQAPLTFLALPLRANPAPAKLIATTYSKIVRCKANTLGRCPVPRPLLELSFTRLGCYIGSLNISFTLAPLSFFS